MRINSSTGSDQPGLKILKICAIEFTIASLLVNGVALVMNI